jgi:hypothetical protein
MTLSHEIARLVEHMMKSAIIESPRFKDYYVAYTPVLPEQMEIERAIDKAIQESQKRTRQRAQGKAVDSSGESEESVAVKAYGAHVQAYMENKKANDYVVDAMLKRLGIEEFDEKWDLSMELEKAVGGAKRGMGAVQNPMHGMEALITKLPHAALVALAVSLAPMIIDELKKPGSWLDVRFVRLMQDEFNAFLERQDQWNTMLGLRQVIVQSQAGFLMSGGASMNENTLRIVRGGGTIADTRLANPNDSFANHTKEIWD